MFPAMHELFGPVRGDNMRGIQFQRQEKVIKKYLLCLVVCHRIPGGYGFPPLVSSIAGIGLLLLVLKKFGRKSDAAAGQA